MWLETLADLTPCAALDGSLWQDLADLQSEASVLARLRHPHCLRFYGIGNVVSDRRKMTVMVTEKCACDLEKVLHNPASIKGADADVIRAWLTADVKLQIAVQVGRRHSVRLQPETHDLLAAGRTTTLAV